MSENKMHYDQKYSALWEKDKNYAGDGNQSAWTLERVKAQDQKDQEQACTCPTLVDTRIRDLFTSLKGLNKTYEVCKLSNETDNVAPDLATLRRRDLERRPRVMA
ncbi:hypothetical protein NQ318_015508 [Aromia moschata]|uniref:Uncharacterized protein n=1 Tax=Aromia moschata TaxID=1265417 RepID=A0AAV8XQZ0_9CUCU|nr:hypothetical protein NQ318_015508 [Aromia moschata]